MKRPIESDYTSHVAYARALEEYCDTLAQPAQEPVAWIEHYQGSIAYNPYKDAAKRLPDGVRFNLYTTPPAAQPAEEPVARIAVLEAALNEIASAGMSPSPEMSDDGKTAWHASQAWRFIGIAARAIELAPAPVGERCCYHDSDCAVHNMPAYPAGPCDCSLASLAQPAQEPVAWMTQARNFVNLMEFTEAEAKLYGWTPVYIAPPAAQRTWVGLTDEERAECWSSSAKQSAINIETKLKEKNT